VKYVDEFRDSATCRSLLGNIADRLPSRPVTIMEVCGTHTHAIARSGLRAAVPEGLSLLSGPGCPVCVTAVGEIDCAVELAGRDGVTLCTFGDMIRVPGSESTLADARAAGASVELCYSPMEAVELAERDPGRQVVFVGVGFETTAPTVAGAALEARRLGLRNFSLLVSHKLIPPAMLALLAHGEVAIDAFLCPGHVSVIIGSNAYRPVVERFRVPCVVGGFEPADVLQAISLMLDQLADGRAEVETQYSRAVRPDGNPRARAIVDRVFALDDARWRGIGTIPGSGLKLRPEFAEFDALERFGVEVKAGREHPACRCGDVLRGVLRARECGAFGRLCTPDSPLGPCMVSSEGACSAEYRYGPGRAAEEDGA